MRHLFCVENIDHWGSNWPLGAKMCFFDTKIWIFGAKSQFLFSDRNFCWWNKWPLYPGLQLSHRNHPQKISVSELGVIFWGSPLFLAVFGHSHFRGATTLNFGPISTKLGGTVRVIKKWPRRTTDPVRAGITEKRAFLRSAEKWFLA